MTDLLPGRIAVTARALSSTVTAIAARHLGTTPRETSVRLADVDGLLAVSVSAPLAVPPLRAHDDGPGIPTRIAVARDAIERDVLAIAGSRVGRVSVEITRVHIIEPRRVS